MTLVGFLLIIFGVLLGISVALNSWENAWHVLSGQPNVPAMLIKAPGT